MNRVAANIMWSSIVRKLCRRWASLLILLVGVVACSDSPSADAPPPSPTPFVEIVGERPAAPSATPSVQASLTPTPTALPTLTPFPTPRQVVVSRVDPDIDPRSVTPIAENAPLPDLTLTDINGNLILLADFAAAGKPLILNFWSVGCGSCFFEFPILQDLYAEYGEDQIGVVGVNIADLPQASRLIADHIGAEFPIVVDRDAALFTEYFNGAVVPTTIFIRADGTVAQVITGPMDRYNFDLQLAALGVTLNDE